MDSPKIFNICTSSPYFIDTVSGQIFQITPNQQIWDSSSNQDQKVIPNELNATNGTQQQQTNSQHSKTQPNGSKHTSVNNVVMDPVGQSSEIGKRILPQQNQNTSSSSTVRSVLQTTQANLNIFNNLNAIAIPKDSSQSFPKSFVNGNIKYVTFTGSLNPTPFATPSLVAVNGSSSENIPQSGTIDIKVVNNKVNNVANKEQTQKNSVSVSNTFPARKVLVPMSNVARVLTDRADSSKCISEVKIESNNVITPPVGFIQNDTDKNLNSNKFKFKRIQTKKSNENISKNLASNDEPMDCDVTTKEEDLYDKFCWICHQIVNFDVDFRCPTCHLSYHSACYVKANKIKSEKKCYECRNFEKTIHSNKEKEIFKIYSPKRLFYYAVTTLSIKDELHIFEKINYDADERVREKSRQLYRKMDINTMHLKNKSGAYKCIENFLFDVRLMLHNSKILFRPHARAVKIANMLQQFAIGEMEDILTCVDCYMYYYEVDDEFESFCKCCNQPHGLIWGKNGSHYWPAKVFPCKDDLVEVRFFGLVKTSIKKNYLKTENCYNFSKNPPEDTSKLLQSQSRNNELYKYAMKQVQRHIEHLNESFDNFYVIPENPTKFNISSDLFLQLPDNKNELMTLNQNDKTKSSSNESKSNSSKKDKSSVGLKIFDKIPDLKRTLVLMNKNIKKPKGVVRKNELANVSPKIMYARYNRYNQIFNREFAKFVWMTSKKDANKSLLQKRKKLETTLNELKEKVAYIKSHEWCKNCLFKQSTIYCCENASYCGEECKFEDSLNHTSSCSKNR